MLKRKIKVYTLETYVSNDMNCLDMFKTNKQTEKSAFTGVLNQCKHKHGTSLAYITKNSELCTPFKLFDGHSHYDLSFEMHN